MRTVTRKMADVRWLAVLAATGALVGGCIIPGVNDGTDDGEAGMATRSQLIVAPQRIAPLAEKDLPNAVLGLIWSAVPEATEYDVYFGLDPNPPLLTTVTTTSYTAFTLPGCQTHYWRIVARRGTVSISSPTWKFETRCP